MSSPTRLSYGAVAAGIGGIALILSLFLDWVGEGPFALNGWEVFSITDIVLLLIGASAILFAVLEAGRMNVRLPVDRVRALTILGIVATTLVWEVILEGDHQKIGIWLAGLASLAILAGGILAERAPELSVAVGGGLGAGAPPAGGPPGQQGGYGQPPAGYAQPPAAGGATSVGNVAPAPQQTAPPQAQPAPQAGSPAPPPGGAADWYPDPRGEKRLRYWDGSQWTHHVAD